MNDLAPAFQTPAALRWAFLSTLVLSGCFTPVRWSDHLAARAYGASRYLTVVDPEEALVGRITPERHHVTVTLEALFLRNVPGVSSGDATVTLEVRGAPSELTTLSAGSVTVSGRDGFLFSGKPLSAGPYLYAGRPLDVTVAVAPGSSQTGASQAWRYQIVLPRCDDATAVARCLTEGTHFFLLAPPVDAPSAVGKVAPSAYLPHLRFEGRKLVWGFDHKPFTALPYVILNITRHVRAPVRPEALRRVLAEVATHCDQGRLELCGDATRRARDALDADAVLGDREKALERSWLAFRDEQIAVAGAVKDGHKERELTGYAQLLQRLKDVVSTAPEVMDKGLNDYVDDRLRDLLRSYERLAQLVGRPKDGLQAEHANLRMLRFALTKQLKAANMARWRLRAKYGINRRAVPPPPELRPR